jgi:monofunctional biosynthetic peptidoglycan transglycosylase
VERRKSRALLAPAALGLVLLAFGGPLAWVGLYGVIEAPGTLLMAQRAAEGEEIRRTPRALSQFSPALVRAVIAAEDSGFCTHDGFEIEAIKDALDRNARGGRLRGGSTISQQTAKNLFLWPQRSWLRKGLEAYFTVLIEAFWSKERILQAYLNNAEWGDGLFGAEAAAQARFGVPANKLSTAQAARLAAVLPSPNRWSADRPGPYVRSRAAQIQARARAVRVQGLDACVRLADAGAGEAAPRQKRKTPAPETLTPLPPLAAPNDALLEQIAEGLTVEEAPILAPAPDTVTRKAAPLAETEAVEEAAVEPAAAAPEPASDAAAAAPQP